MSKRIPIFFGILLVFFSTWLLMTTTQRVRNFIERLDNFGYDIQIRTHIATHKPRLSPVAIIDIDDKSLKAVGRWPWPRSKLSELLNELTKQGAAVVAFDIFFSEKQPKINETVLEKLSQKNLLTSEVEEALKKNSSLFDEDAVFSKSIANSTAILAIGFLPRKVTQNKLPPPLLVLDDRQKNDLSITVADGFISNIASLQDAAKGAGFINIFADSDGIMRRAPLIMEYKGGIYPALSLQAVLLFLSQNIQLITPVYGENEQLEGIQLGSTIIPTDEKGEALIPFVGKSYTFPYYSAIDVMTGKLPKDALLGKILFVGTSATGLGDLHATAIQNPFPGVEIQATLVNGMLQDDFSYKPAWTYGANIVLTLLFGLISAFVFPYLGPRMLGAGIILLPPALLLLNNLIWEQTGLILSFIIPTALVLVIAILNMIYGYLFETRRRERLKEMFGQYVPEKHIDEMIGAESEFGMHGEDRDMSVLFADIRNFTTISEGMPAAEIVDLLNTLFTPMTEIIFKHRGTIDKYVGDLIMAFWGAPLKDKNHSRHAIESALEMLAKINEMKPIIAERKWPEIKIGIGINSGVMSVGDMGSQFRRNYTVLGDEVNLASRVEGLTKFYGVDVIVTEKTQHNQQKFIFRKLDRVRVKGKKTGIEIFEVIGILANITPDMQNALDTYNKALDYYLEQRWDDAYDLMNHLAQKYPDKKIYQIYIERINEFKSNPPPEDWNGIYIHTTK